MLNWSNEIRSIEYTIGNLLQINRTLPNAKQFILGYEPDKQNKVNHRVWNNIREISDFEYVDISESSKIKNYAIDHGIKPLFD